jgi:protocatechuate 4,5-dioxygenase beta chain
MLGLTLATSNVAAIYRPQAAWRTIYEQQATEGVPPPNELQDETDDVVGEQIRRIAAAQATLRERLLAYDPEVVVIVGYDDGVVFNDIQVPQFCTYTGEDLSGSTAVAELGEDPDQHRVTMRCDPAFAWETHEHLIDHGFDVNYMATQHPLGRPEWGTSSAFTRPAEGLLAGMDVAVLPIFINCSVEPAPLAQRCHDFGTALGRILEDSPKRVALLAVGGLSHDPRGPRAGWIDNRLDNWVLSRLAKGDSTRLRTLFDVDSDTLHGGTGQVRTWIAAAAAAETKRGKATVVDYIPALRAMTGLGFAYWDLA